MENLKNLFFQLLTISIISSLVSATGVVKCQFATFSDPPPCLSFTLSPITSANEKIIVENQTSTYLDLRLISYDFDANTILNFIPTNLFKYFPYAVQFSAVNSSVNTVLSNAFVWCPNMGGITMNFNNFSHLPASFAEACVIINQLYLQHNHIKTIDVDALKGLTKLTSFSISNNEITCIPPGLFDTAPDLRTLDLSYNQIKFLHTDTFKNLAFLDYCDLFSNNLEFIPNLLFGAVNTSLYDSMSFQHSIRFDNNPINSISPNFFSTLFTGKIGYFITVMISVPCVGSQDSSITTLNWQQISGNYGNCYSGFTPSMDDNSLIICSDSVSTTTVSSTLSTTESISTTQAQIQCATDKICRYYLDWNNTYTCVIDGAEGTVTSISGAHYLSFVDSDVARVYFTNSNLNLVPNILFQKFINLKYLHVANAGLSVINDQTFNECGNLELLDASNNNIIHVDETALRNCTKLRVIDLTGNQINYVSGGLYQLDPALERVHLTRLDDWILA